MFEPDGKIFGTRSWRTDVAALGPYVMTSTQIFSVRLSHPVNKYKFSFFIIGIESGFLNNLVTLANCESLKEIGEVAGVTPARSSRGQTLKVRGLAFLFNLHSSSKDMFRSV